MTGAGTEVSERPAVRCDEFDGISVITLDRPADGNAMSSRMLCELAQITTALRTAGSARAVLLTGAGKTFCVGGDLAELATLAADGSTRELAELTDVLMAVIRDLRHLDCPVIAAVNGLAAGAGFSLALACDFRIASDRSAFHFAYGELGSSTDGGMAWFLPRIVGADKALSLLLRQPILRASQALELRLVSEVVPAAELLDVALRRGRELGRHGRHAVRAAKRLLNLSFALSLESHLFLEHDEFVKGMVSEDI